MSRSKKPNSGVRYFCGATVILFAAVFIMSKLTRTDDIEKNDSSVTDSSSSVTAENEPLSKEDGQDIVTEPEVTQETTETETETAPADEPMPDPDDADNTWAMFLVNGKNAVPKEYCNSIETSLVYESWRKYYMDSRMSDYLTEMLEAASDDGHQLIVMSAYRDIEYQQNNFDKSVEDRMENKGMTYEEAYADTLKEVQLPGYSEHNAGLAADIMSDEETSMEDERFERTKAFEWLSENAADYGFILRYPKGKEEITGIVYEPWHYRFVGVYYAKLLTERGITLEEYFEEMNWVDENGVAVDHLPEIE